MKKWTVATKRWYLRIGDNRGLILPLALLVFVILGALTAAILSTGGSEAQIASNHLRAVQAEFLAEAGLERAFNTVQTTPSLTTSAGTGLTNIVDTQTLGVAGSGNSIGTYTVQYQAAGYRTVRVVSTGTTTIGGSQQIRRAIISTAFTPREAILTGGDLSIGGNAGTGDPVFGGQCAGVHTNDDLDLYGNASIPGPATASGDGDPDPTYSAGGSTTVGAGSGAVNYEKFVPDFDPAYYLGVAKGSLAANRVFQMKANGEVRDGSNADGGQGTLITTLGNPPADNTYCGWRYNAGSPPEWQFNDNTVPPGCNGTFYLDGNATVGGNPESWKTTLIVTGNLEVTGSPVITADPSYTVTSTLFIAGRDVKIHGNASNSPTYNGLIGAHEQFELSGTVIVNGAIIGKNAEALSSLVTSNTVSGTITINYDCSLTPPIEGPPTILSWGL